MCSGRVGGAEVMLVGGWVVGEGRLGKATRRTSTMASGDGHSRQGMVTDLVPVKDR